MPDGTFAGQADEPDRQDGPGRRRVRLGRRPEGRCSSRRTDERRSTIWHRSRPTGRAEARTSPEDGMSDAPVSVSHDGDHDRVRQRGPEPSARGGRRLPRPQAGRPRDVSHANDKLLAELDLPRPESGQGDGRRRHADADVDPQAARLRRRRRNGRSPILVHGGPQGAWEDGWSYRWNPQLWAAQGYVVALPNPRGSDRLRPEVRRRNHRRLGRQVLRRPHGRPRLPGEAALHRQGPHGRGRGVVRRLHDELVRGQHRQVQDAHHATAASGTSTACTPRPTNSGSTSGSTAARRGARTAQATRSSRRTSKAGNLGKFKTPMLVIHNDLDFRCPVGQGQRAVHDAAAAGRAVASSSTSPTRATGC